MTSPIDERPELADKLSELEILRQSLVQVKAKERDIFDQLLRLNAEYQNFRKRSEQRISEARTAGKEEILLPVISLADIVAQADLASANATDVESVKKGVKMLRDQFEKFLKEQGLVAISAKGERLDPHRHEAIAQVLDGNLEEGTVVDEIQRGYTLNGQVVRPARVRVAAKPAPAEEPAKTKEE